MERRGNGKKKMKVSEQDSKWEKERNGCETALWNVSL